MAGEYGVVVLDGVKAEERSLPGLGVVVGRMVWVALVTWKRGAV